jgi:hypothetical protein
MEKEEGISATANDGGSFDQMDAKWKRNAYERDFFANSKRESFERAERSIDRQVDSEGRVRNPSRRAEVIDRE